MLLCTGSIVCAGRTAAFFLFFKFFFPWWYNNHNNGVCGRNLCKLFTINLKKGSGGCFCQGKEIKIWGSFFLPLDFCNFLGGGRAGGLVEDVRHDVLCLNVFECLYSEMSMYVDIKEKTYPNDLCILSSLNKFKIDQYFR